MAKVKEAQALPDPTDADTYSINRFLGFIVDQSEGHGHRDRRL